MTYKIVFEKDAEKFLRKQAPVQQTRLLRAIYKLPFEGDIKSMAGYKNYYRLRVGTYRVLYTIENEIVTVRIVNIGNRGDIYKTSFNMSDIVKKAARMMNMLPDEDQNFAYEFIEKLVLAWDPDYTKLTAEVAVLHEVAEKGEFVDSKDIDGNQIGNRNNRQVVRPVGLRFYE